MTNKLPVISFVALIFLIISPLINISLYAQNSGNDLKADQEKFWIEYAAALRKIKAESDDHKAALMVQQLKQEYIPRMQVLVKEAKDWKKLHSVAEKKAMEEWSEKNIHGNEAGSLQTDLMIRAGKGGEFGKAYGDYMQSLVTAGKQG